MEIRCSGGRKKKSTDVLPRHNSSEEKMQNGWMES